jgi:hypothetical protein
LNGRAAYAADILDELARDVQMSDFTDIPRIEPRLAFSGPEKDVIDYIDRKAVSELTRVAS